MKKELEIAILCICLLIVGIASLNLTDYVYEEAQSDFLDDELSALHAVAYYSAQDEPVPETTAVPVMTDYTEQHTQEPAESIEDNPAEIQEYTADENIQDNIQVSIQDSMQDNTQDCSSVEDDIPVSTEEPSATAPAQTSEPSASSLSSLHAANSDCVAWITISDTRIDYPVMHKPDSVDYYMYRDFYGNESKRGTLFVSEICSLNSDNLIIYGHNMSSGAMFAGLTRYKDKSYGNSHRYITLETLSGVRKYELICALALSVDSGNDFRFYCFSHANSAYEFEAYMKQCLERAYYSTGVTAGYGDQLLTLVTCEYSHDNGRMLVVAKRIS